MYIVFCLFVDDTPSKRNNIFTTDEQELGFHKYFTLVPRIRQFLINEFDFIARQILP